MDDEQSILYRRVARHEAARHEVKRLINYYGRELAEQVFREEFEEEVEGSQSPQEHRDYR